MRERVQVASCLQALRRPAGSMMHRKEGAPSWVHIRGIILFYATRDNGEGREAALQAAAVWSSVRQQLERFPGQNAAPHSEGDQQPVMSGLREATFPSDDTTESLRAIKHSFKKRAISLTTQQGKLAY